MDSQANRTDRWRRYWDKQSKSYDRSMGFLDRVLFAGSRDWVCRQAVGEVLEVAIGTGLNLAHYPPDVRLTGIELSPALLQIARRRAADLHREIDLREGDAHQLDFPDASFDTVVCTFSLCAIQDERQAVSEMRRVLRPGGLLLHDLPSRPARSRRLPRLPLQPSGPTRPDRASARPSPPELGPIHPGGPRGTLVINSTGARQRVQRARQFRSRTMTSPWPISPLTAPSAGPSKPAVPPDVGSWT